MLANKKTESFRKLGIVGGSGDLPAKLVNLCNQIGRPYILIGFRGETDASLMESVPHRWARIGAIGETIQFLKEQGIEELVLAGKIRRPRLSDLSIDFGGARLLARIGASKLAGDDAILSVVVKYLEDQDFHIVGVDQVLTDVVAPTGVIGSIRPPEDAWEDIKLGVRIARAIGELDVGQAVVTQRGLVLGVEAAEGTDALIRRAASLKHEGPGPVLVKIKKPGQERRVDLPTIGAATIDCAVKGGFLGIAIEAGSSLIIDREDVARLADMYGLFVIGLTMDAEGNPLPL